MLFDTFDTFHTVDTVDGRKKSPLTGSRKEIDKEYNDFLLKFSVKCRVLHNRFLFFSRDPGGFRELREAGRKHFHLSWYLSVPVVTSYDQKP